jgi:heme/copper-type cytochrome/quinol oxidase subunit 2
VKYIFIKLINPFKNKNIYILTTQKIVLMESNRIKLMNNKLSILSPELGNAFKYAMISLFMFFIPLIGFIIALFMNLFVVYYLYQNNKKNNLNNYYHILGIFGIIGFIVYSIKTATDPKNQINNIKASTTHTNQDNTINNAPNTSSNNGNQNYEDEDFLDDDKVKSYDVVYEPAFDPKRVNKNNFQKNNFNNSPIAPQSGFQNFIIWTFVVLLIFVLVIVYAVTYFIDKYGINLS